MSGLEIEETKLPTAVCKSVLIGVKAGELLQAGVSNILVGYQAGANLIRGDNNFIIGDGVSVEDTNGSNQLIINTGEVSIKLKLEPEVAAELCESFRKAIQSRPLMTSIKHHNS